ncbi:hypothetical protein NL676_029618 [Syzygium grande]|nr:hypothetical protein NL676_029618 [Syzygium grande]
MNRTVTSGGLRLGTSEVHGSKFTDELTDGEESRPKRVLAETALGRHLQKQSNSRQQNHQISSDGKIEQKHQGTRDDSSFPRRDSRHCNTSGATSQASVQRQISSRSSTVVGVVSARRVVGRAGHGGLGSNTSDKLGSVGSLREQARRLMAAGFVVTNRGSSNQSNNVRVDVKLAARKQRQIVELGRTRSRPWRRRAKGGRRLSLVLSFL